MMSPMSILRESSSSAGRDPIASERLGASSSEVLPTGGTASEAENPVVYTVTAVAIPSISKGAENPVLERFASILAKSESCPGVEIG